MVSEEGTSKSRPGVGSDGVILNAVCPETDSQKLFESCFFFPFQKFCGADLKSVLEAPLL